MESLDCVVVGAGVFGLAAAKQFHVLNPECSLAVFESDATLGGTWASSRLYTGLKSNNLLGTYEYPDFPMDPKVFNVQQRKHVPGQVIHDYLEAYARNFGIFPLIRFNSKVTVAEHQELGATGGWELTVMNSSTGKESTLFARRLIVANGVTSEPRPLFFKGQESFGRPIFHGKEFRHFATTIDTSKVVTVVGGSKYAWDAVYAYVTAGVRVNWVIRESGRGPTWQSSPFVTPFKRWIEELANTRLLTWFSPCIWGPADGYGTIRRLLHRTYIGRLLVGGFWKVIMNDVLSLNKYESHPNTAKLKPWDDVMSTGTSYGLINYETDIWDVIKSDLVNIHISDVAHLSPGSVHLADGTKLEADALLAHTGWKQTPTIKFLPEGIESDLGIPSASGEGVSEAVSRSQQGMLDEADTEIQVQLPMLANRRTNGPHGNSKPGKSAKDSKIGESFLLYRFLVPSSHRFLMVRDIVFVGLVQNFSNITNAHIQGLWASAYFNGQLLRDPGRSELLENKTALENIRREAILHNRYGKWRYPSDWGVDKSPSFIFDAVPYFDLLLRDLGVNSWRKGPFWREILGPYGPRDYKNINEEWLQQIAGRSTSLGQN